MANQDATKTRPIFKILATKVAAWHSCKESEIRSEWAKIHSDRLYDIMKDHAPSGSGFDSGTQLDLGNSTGEKLIFETSFHHMDSNGYYTQWTQHKVTVTPSLMFDIDIRVSGRDENGIIEYIYECFRAFLLIEMA